MASRLIIDGNAVYEIDEDCVMRKAGACGSLTRQSVAEEREEDGLEEKKDRRQVE